MTAVDPRLVAAINALTLTCETRDTDGRRCTDPATWIVTFTPLHRGLAVTRVVYCIACWADVDTHHAGCPRCTAMHTITAAEL